MSSSSGGWQSELQRRVQEFTNVEVHARHAIEQLRGSESRADAAAHAHAVAKHLDRFAKLLQVRQQWS